MKPARPRALVKIAEKKQLCSRRQVPGQHFLETHPNTVLPFLSLSLSLSALTLYIIPLSSSLFTPTTSLFSIQTQTNFRILNSASKNPFSLYNVRNPNPPRRKSPLFLAGEYPIFSRQVSS
jgi:hypothetical protein